MAFLYFLVYYSCSCILHTAAYTLIPSQSIADGEYLISEGETFKLGFFSPASNSRRRYLGIWYNTIPTQTVVWVANRNSPLLDTSGVLKISPTTGNLVILNQTDSVIWSSNSSQPVESPIVEFLVSGNLVLRGQQNEDPQDYLWQSFSSPTGTLLPGMKIGQNMKTGMHHYLSSWKNSDDPSHGNFTMDVVGYREPVLKNGSEIYYRGGLFNGIHNSGTPDLEGNSLFTNEAVSNEEEMYYMYQMVEQSVLFRIALFSDGHIERLIWVNATSSWHGLVSIPRDRCDKYAMCGVYSTCDVTKLTACQCLNKFKPKSPVEWDSTYWTQGCEREISLNCTQGDGFMKLNQVKLPDTTSNNTFVDTSMNLKECREECLKNCSCMAYANIDIRGDGSGCVIWFTDLIDIRQLNNAEHNLYIRMAKSALDSTDNSRPKRRVIMIASITLAVGIIVLGLGIWVIWKRESMKGVSESEDIELPLYDLDIITNSTNSFSLVNKLGEGGFGPVYRGKLRGGQDIAVKRLSKDSIQGVTEFKNEVILISKLQHINLVRLLGCCIQGEEKMLIYEYMQNKSLDLFIFDSVKSKLLHWQKRFDIILGIARGLLYLHHDSRLRIIHRDLKVSNILLDGEMIPKISDFGMARLFGRDQTEAQTKRVVGTYGYMSPEYALDGNFSMKSDVFSFGVLVLEIISGKKNRGFCHPEHDHNLLGHAWRLWNEDRCLELVDETVADSYIVEDVLRCIHIGLLCVQRESEQRPSMPYVMLLLSSETSVLLKPQEPGFYIQRSTSRREKSSSSDKEESGSGYSNERSMSMTSLDGR